jgi:uncharacterized protein (TIGR02453 family)
MPEALRETLEFLRQLRANNTRQWFEEHRAQYEHARGCFQDVVTDLIHQFEPVDDLGHVTAKDCMFRINRDVRFSNDKSPYKSTMSAVLGQGGRKSTVRSYYFHIEPDGGAFLAGGLYAPTTQELGKMREALAENAKRFKQIVHAPDFIQYFGGISGESLKTAPQGYTKDHPEIELLRLKQYLASHKLSDEQMLSADLVAHTLTVFKAMKPLLVYIENVTSV